MFAAFTRAHSERDAELGTGVGLGLAIVADRVRAVGAHLTLSSRVGEGTTFTIAFAPRA